MARSNHSVRAPWRFAILSAFAFACAIQPSPAQTQSACDASPPLERRTDGVHIVSAAATLSPLQITVSCVDRVKLTDGNEVIRVTGRILNPNSATVPVPALDAQVRSKSGQLIHRWTIMPSATALSPGGSAPFDQSEPEVPPGGDDLTITIGVSLRNRSLG
jgi:hypothetical protein